MTDPLKKDRDIRDRGVAVFVLAERQIAPDQRAYRRKRSVNPVRDIATVSLLAQYLIDLRRQDTGAVASGGIHPLGIARLHTVADETGTRGAQGDEFMGIDRKVGSIHGFA